LRKPSFLGGMGGGEQARLLRSLSVPVKLMGDDREVIGRSHMIVYPWNR
jgi:hypothetical protein